MSLYKEYYHTHCYKLFYYTMQESFIIKFSFECDIPSHKGVLSFILTDEMFSNTEFWPIWKKDKACFLYFCYKPIQYGYFVYAKHFAWLVRISLSSCWLDMNVFE